MANEEHVALLRQKPDDALAQLVSAELIYRRGTPPDAEYTFKHALVQDAAYSTLLRSRRQQLHGRIAATLEGRFQEIVAAQPALLAHHCTEAGLTEQAIAYWLAAGRQAWGRSAAAEAVALLHRGLALVPALPDGDGRRETELDLRIALGRALIVNQSWGAPELVEVHSRARELASTLNRPRALLFALWGQFTDHWARADLKRARRLAAELRELGDTTGDVLMQVLGCDAGGTACFHLGEFAAGRAYLEKGLALYDPAHRPSYSELLSHDARVFLRIHSSWLLACLGHLDQALLQRDAAQEEARRLSHPPTLAIALSAAWVTGWFVRLEPGSLLQCADEQLALTTEHGLGNYRMAALIRRGWCLAALGRADEGVSLINAGLAGYLQLGFMVWRPRDLTLLGDACRMAGQWQAALEHFAEARRLAEKTEERCFQAETLRLTGDLLLSMGDPAAAETSYGEALALAQQQSAKLWELRAATSLARLRRDQGEPREAHPVAFVLERAGISYTLDEVHDLVAHIERLRPFPEVPEALARLQTRYPLVVLSNGDPDMLETAKRYHGIPFDRVISVAVANAFKPHVATYTKAAEIVGVHMDEVLFIANHAFDCIGAKSAGMRTAFIDRRRRPFGITPHQPDLTVPTMQDLADALV